MKVMVLGAAGFIGSAIVARLASACGPQAVVAGVHRSAARFDASHIEVKQVDATDPRSLDSACAGVTHLVDCVAGAPAAIVASTRATVEVARRHDLRLLHMSSIAIYGDAEGDVTEEARLGDPLDRYGATKFAAETMVREAKSAGLRSVIFRPALVYGPGSAAWTARIALLLRAGRLGDLGPAGMGLCNLVYVDDVAAAAVAALTQADAEGRVFNLAAPSPPTWNDYLRDFGHALDLPPKTVSPRRLAMERGLAYPLHALKIVASKVGRTTPEPIGPGLARLFGRRVRYDSTNAAILLPSGWTAYEDGIAASAAWARNLA